MNFFNETEEFKVKEEACYTELIADIIKHAMSKESLDGHEVSMEKYVVYKPLRGIIISQVEDVEAYSAKLFNEQKVLTIITEYLKCSRLEMDAVKFVMSQLTDLTEDQYNLAKETYGLTDDMLDNAKTIKDNYDLMKNKEVK